MSRRGVPWFLAWQLRRWRKRSGLSDCEVLAAIAWALRIVVTASVGDPSLENREALINAGKRFTPARSTDFIKKG